MTSNEYLTEALATVYRALATMDGLITEAISVIPENVLHEQGPEDVNNDENTLATFEEIQTLQTSCDEIIHGLLNLYSATNLGEPAKNYIDLIGVHEETIKKIIPEILEKYDGDVVSDEH